MTTIEPLLTTSELAERRGVSRQAIAQAVRRGRLQPAMVLGNGYFLFASENPVVVDAPIGALQEGK